MDYNQTEHSKIRNVKLHHGQRFNVQKRIEWISVDSHPLMIDHLTFL